MTIEIRFSLFPRNFKKYEIVTETKEIQVWRLSHDLESKYMLGNNLIYLFSYDSCILLP